MDMQFFYFHTTWSHHSTDKIFKGFGALWQLLLKVKFQRENHDLQFCMSCRHHLDDFIRRCTVANLQEGRTNKKEFDISYGLCVFLGFEEHFKDLDI